MHPIHLFYPRDIPIPVLVSDTHAFRAGVAVAGVLVGYPIGDAPKTGTPTGIPALGGRSGMDDL